MELEKNLLGKLTKRLCHTSNEDVCMIPNERLHKHSYKKRSLQGDSISQGKTRTLKVFDNYQELMLFKTDD